MMTAQKVAASSISSSKLSHEKPIFNAPDGILFAAQKNKNQCFIIPSSKNFVELPNPEKSTLQIRALKYDTGSNYTLLYWESSSAMEFFLLDCFKDPVVKPKLRLVRSNSPGGEFVMLVISFQTSAKLSVCTDIFPSVIPLLAESLHFHMCSEDIDLFATSNAIKSVVGNIYNSLLSKLRPSTHVQTGPAAKKRSATQSVIDIPEIIHIPRRKWGLLGVDVTKNIPSFRTKNVIFFCDFLTHQPATWSQNLLLEAEFESEDYLESTYADFEESKLLQGIDSEYTCGEVFVPDAIDL